ncbi:MAG: hypothetical protein ACYTFA_01095 [Planctomycetota bacterium]
MNTTRTITIIATCAVVLARTVALGEPVGTAFTYQGQLKGNGVPSNVTADFDFTLWDAESDGTEIGYVHLPSVEVEHGLFTVELDFGAAAFGGAARWLQIAVALPSGGGNWTVLPGRHPITPTPYALYALQTRGLFTDDALNVGIGTSNPNFTLEVYDSGDSDTPPTTLGVHWVKPGVPHSLHEWFYFAVGGGPGTVHGTRLIRESGTELHFQTREGISTGSVSSQMMLDADGHVGIGTTHPDGRLHIWKPSSSSPVLQLDTQKISGDFTMTEKLLFHGASIDAEGTLGDLPIKLNPNSSGDVYLAGGGGQVGIGTASPGAPLEVQGTGTFGEPAVLIANELGMGLNVHANSYLEPAVYIRNYGNDLGLLVYSEIHTAAKFVNTAGKAVEVWGQSDDTAALEIHQAGDGPGLWVSGAASVEVLHIRGADVAEKFPVTEQVTPGMVVAIDPDHSGKLCLARGAYNRRVAGVVSGANDLPAGAVLGHLPGMEHAPPVALSGRVWVNCDATDHSITPGDLLTTATRPGYAMKVIHQRRAQGAILGKAMTALDEGTGLVLVLVTLQ